MALAFTRALEEAKWRDLETLREFRSVLKTNEALLKGSETFEEVGVESIPAQYLTV
jgi:hypothetical protein